jgi:hypothetical protein
MSDRFRLDASHVWLFLATFIPAAIKALQAALGAGQKLDVLTVLLLVFPILLGTVNLLKQSPIVQLPPAPAVPPQATVTPLGFKKPSKKN